MESASISISVQTQIYLYTRCVRLYYTIYSVKFYIHYIYDTIYGASIEAL